MTSGKYRSFEYRMQLPTVTITAIVSSTYSLSRPSPQTLLLSRLDLGTTKVKDGNFLHGLWRGKSIPFLLSLNPII